MATDLANSLAMPGSVFTLIVFSHKVSVKLDDNNFLLWWPQVLSAIKGHRIILNYVSNSVQPPPKLIMDDDRAKIDVLETFAKAIDNRSIPSSSGRGQWNPYAVPPRFGGVNTTSPPILTGFGRGFSPNPSSAYSLSTRLVCQLCSRSGHVALRCSQSGHIYCYVGDAKSIC
uniref:CCHC-type domain-containing protein n=1 Tax=Cannabis sativa TaxID=3483 RepID=A0A803QAR8_CANSA